MSETHTVYEFIVLDEGFSPIVYQAIDASYDRGFAQALTVIRKHLHPNPDPKTKAAIGSIIDGFLACKEELAKGGHVGDSNSDTLILYVKLLTVEVKGTCSTVTLTLGDAPWTEFSDANKARIAKLHGRE